MPKYTPTSSRKISLRAPKQVIVNYCCPGETIEAVEAALVRIKAKASEGSSVRSFPPKEHTFKCKSCGHDEAYEEPSGWTCKKCKVVQGKVHSGKEWRDIQERTREKGDLNHCGMQHNTHMSTGYNLNTFLSQRDHRGKQLSSKFKKLPELHMEKMVGMDTKDKHVLRAKAAFADICDRVHYGANVNEAMKLFTRFLNSVKRLESSHIVHAACMFHTLKQPQGKAWKKVFRNKTKFNDSKKKRLKWVNLKRPVNKKLY